MTCREKRDRERRLEKTYKKKEKKIEENEAIIAELEN